MNSRNSQKKVGLTWMAVSGAITVILTWGFDQFSGVEVSVEVGQSFTIVISFIGAYIGSNVGRKRDNGWR